MTEICKGVLKLEKTAKKLGGDKYSGELSGSDTGTGTMTIYIPQSVSRPGNTSTCRPQLQLTLYYYPLNSAAVKSEDIIKSYKFELDKPAKSGGGDKFVAASDPDFNIYVPQNFSRRLFDDGLTHQQLRHIIMVISVFPSISRSSVGRSDDGTSVVALVKSEPFDNVCVPNPPHLSSSSSSARDSKCESEDGDDAHNSRALDRTIAGMPSKVRRIVYDDDDDKTSTLGVGAYVGSIGAGGVVRVSSGGRADTSTDSSAVVNTDVSSSSESIESKQDHEWIP